MNSQIELDSIIEAINRASKIGIFTHISPDGDAVGSSLGLYLGLKQLKKDVILKQLNKASNFIERELSKRVEIRKMPDITFVYDESLEYAANIENIIESTKNNE